MMAALESLSDNSDDRAWCWSLIQVVVFPILGVLSDFQSYPGHFVSDNMSFWIL